MFKQLGFLIIFFLLPSGLMAQKQISGYEYWFNENYPEKTKIDIADAESVTINTSISSSGLPPGLNILNIRTFDADGFNSGTLSHFFYKRSEIQNETIESYQYWLDNDYASTVNIAATAEQGLSIGELLNMTGLSEGLHVLNIRFRDKKGFRSSTLSHFFYKTETGSSDIKQIVSCQYWLDDDYDNMVIKALDEGQTLAFNDILNTGGINEGLHVLNIRFRDNHGAWSSTQGHFFYLKDAGDAGGNVITGYRYWLNDVFENAVSINLDEPVSKFLLAEDIDLSGVTSGKHSIHFQFRDTAGEWSIVTTDSVSKLATPVADFELSVDNRCDSAIVTFTNKSIESDLYNWDFGDGSTDQSANPVHVYHQPGNYEVSLRASNSENDFSSEKILSFVIKGHTYGNLETEICNSYLSPSGKYRWTESGIYKDTIPNHAGCDSIITITLTVKNADVSVTKNAETLTAGAVNASYQWLDCSNNYSEILGATGRSFTAASSGNFALRVNENGCVDTSQCYAVTISDVELLYRNDFKVFPNPTSGYFQVHTGEPISSLRAVLYDSQGRKVNELLLKDVDTFDMVIDGPRGVYMLELYWSDQRAVYRLIRE